MRNARTEWRREHARGHHENQRRQVDVAEARRGSPSGAQALEDVPQGARQRDRQADGGRRADWLAATAPGTKRGMGIHEKGAARGKQARYRADRCARRKEAKSARELARAFGRKSSRICVAA